MALKLTIVIALLASYLFFWPRNLDMRLPAKKINGIVFLDPNHGYVQELTLSHPETYETLDGGKTWKKMDEGVPGFRTGRSFVTKLKGWSIDEKSLDDDAGTYNTAQTVYQTQDGGHTWQPCLKTDRKGDFVFGGIQAISETEVWVTGISGTYHTADEGKTWERLGSPGTALQFLDDNRGWIVGDKLWHTDNAGRTWQIVENEGKTCFGGLGFFFLNDQRGWGVSGETEGQMEGGARTGHVIATTDGGKTCGEIGRVPGQILWSVFFLNEREGWAGGIGSLLRTEDGGRTWSETSGK
jgi:photosystem II stability/assembly factor-like uncharacterized protein